MWLCTEVVWTQVRCDSIARPPARRLQVSGQKLNGTQTNAKPRKGGTLPTVDFCGRVGYWWLIFGSALATFSLLSR